MPVISLFYRIIIRMFYKDHIPPNFHAVSGEYELSVGILSILFLRVKSMVLEWSALYQQAFLDNWNRSRQAESLLPIEPLESNKAFFA